MIFTGYVDLGQKDSQKASMETGDQLSCRNIFCTTINVYRMVCTRIFPKFAGSVDDFCFWLVLT